MHISIIAGKEGWTRVIHSEDQRAEQRADGSCEGKAQQGGVLTPLGRERKGYSQEAQAGERV